MCFSLLFSSLTATPLLISSCSKKNKPAQIVCKVGNLANNVFEHYFEFSSSVEIIDLEIPDFHFELLGEGSSFYQGANPTISYNNDDKQYTVNRISWLPPDTTGSMTITITKPKYIFDGILQILY